MTLDWRLNILSIYDFIKGNFGSFSVPMSNNREYKLQNFPDRLHYSILLLHLFIFIIFSINKIDVF